MKIHLSTTGSTRSKAVKLCIILLIALSAAACKTTVSQDQASNEASTEEIQVYYFHFTKRCATCNAVENETRLAIEMIYAEEVQEGNIAFTSLNLEEEDGRKLGEQLQVSGQALLLVKGNQVVNLTNEAFLNARTRPDQFHEILIGHIDKLL